MWFLRPFVTLYRFFAGIVDAWRDIAELTRVYAPSDFVDYRHLEETCNEPPVNDAPPDADEVKDCGRCNWCERAVWYKITYSSAGIPVPVLLCYRCGWDLVQRSPHILEAHLTARRARRIRRGGEQPPSTDTPASR